MDSDIPTQSIGKKSQLGDLHLAFVLEKEVAEEHAHWRQPEMKEKIGAQTRMDPGASAWGRRCLRGWWKSAIVFRNRNWRKVKSVPFRSTFRFPYQ